MLYDLVAFDLYGTLLDIGGLAERMRPIVGDGAPELLARWRRAQLESSWDSNRVGAYEPWDVLTLRALDSVAPELDPAARGRLADLWLAIPAYPDAAEALDAIRSAGGRSAVLSNGTVAMIRRALDSAWLGVDRILSADDVGVYKTDPRVYALLDAVAPRSRTLFVSGNGWDAEGAARDGRSVAWIDRGGEPPGVSPTRRVRSLREIGDLVAG
jgi:2-haloacid dehalogenase